MVLKCPHFITTLRTPTSPEDGHAVDEGAANTSFFLLGKERGRVGKTLCADAQMAKRSVRWL